jgi:O-antigen/teichoic acid export membrane protein
VSVLQQEPAALLPEKNDLDSAEPVTHLRSHAVRGVGAMVASRTICQGILVLSSVILARLLSPKDFGLVAMVTVFSGILLEFGSLRLSDATVQKRDLRQHQLSALFWINVVAGLVVAGILALCAPLISKFYGEPRLTSIVIAIASTFVLSGLCAQQLALLQRKMEFRRMAILDITATAFGVMVAIGTALSGFGYWALVLRRIGYGLASTVGIWSISRWRPGKPIIDEGVRSMLKFGANNLGSYSLTYFSRNLDNLLIGWRLGPGQLGIYDRAYQIFVMPVYQLMNPLATVAVSALSRVSDDRERYVRYFSKSLKMVVFFAVPLSAWVTLAGSDIVITVLGQKWAAAGHILQAFGPGIVVMLINGKQQWLHISLGRADRFLRWNLLRFLVTSAFLICGLRYGAVGVAIGSVAAFYVLAGPGIIYAGRPVGLRLKTCWWDIVKFLVAGVVSAGIAWSLVYSNGGLAIHLAPVWRIITSCAVVLASYITLTMLLLRGWATHIEALALAKSMLPKRKGSSHRAQ